VLAGKNDLINQFSLEDLDELKYLKMVYYETLRLESTNPISSDMEVTEPITIGGVKIMTGTKISTVYPGPHYDPS
jgi:cytochrome P450